MLWGEVGEEMSNFFKRDGLIAEKAKNAEESAEVEKAEVEKIVAAFEDFMLLGEKTRWFILWEAARMPK